MVQGQIPASTWANEVATLKTGAGTEIKIDGRGMPMKIGEASVVRMNKYASNGKIHAIDRVLTN